MLSRIYGTGWLNKKQLDAHLLRLEEAAKRDHRKLGAEMDLFHLQSEAQGSRSSGTPRASACGGRWRRTCAAASTRRAMRK